VCPVHDPSPENLDEMIRSVLDQTYERWTLVLVDDGSAEPAVRSSLAAAADHPDITLVRHERSRGIVGATNRGIEATTADLVAFVDHDDVLVPEALEWVAAAAEGAEMVYSDDDQMLPDGTRTLPFFKPAWSPRLLLGMNYLSHLVAVQRSLLDDLGGLVEGTSGAQDHDLALRLSERTGSVAHVPAMLYQWRQAPGSVAAAADAKPWAEAAAVAVVQNALDRRRWKATARPTGEPYRFQVHFTETPGSVAVVAATTPADVDRQLAGSDADVIVLTAGLDLEEAAARQLAGWLVDEGVAAAGGMIVAESGEIISCGWIAGKEAYPYGGGRPTTPRPFIEVAREVSLLDGLCLALRAADYRAAGGLAHDRPLRHAATDLAGRLGRRGALVVDPTVVAVATGDLDPVPSPTSGTADPYASPHLGPPDGMTILEPPRNVAERRQRLAPRRAPNLA
jgi:hypothetical protein